MALGSLPALGVQTPQINTLGNFEASRANAMQAKSTRMAQEAEGLKGLATVSLGVLRGNLDGQADPQEWEQALDLLQTNGADENMIAELRGKPGLANVLARGSLETMNAARDEAQFELAKKKFEADLAQAAKGGGLDETYAMQPTYYRVTDPATGKPVVKFGQLGNRGTFKEIALPDGAEPAIPVQQLNTETGFQPVTKFGDLPADAPVTPINNQQAAFDTGIGKGEAELAVAKPEKARKAEGALNALERQTGLVTESIDKAIAQADGNPLFNTGFLGDLTKATAGTPAYDLAQTLLTIQSNVGFDTLQEMRNNSPTGGALGAISDTETRLLQAVKGATAQGQSAEQFKANLATIKDLYAQVLAERKAAFAKDYGGGGGGAPAPSGDAGGGDEVVNAEDYFTGGN